MNILNAETLLEFEHIIGYSFSDISLLEHALRHSSYANEKRMERKENNERLEFLGDAVLELVTSEYLYAKDSAMPEGDMTKTRASIVCEQTLALCAKDIDLGDYVLLGKGEEATGGRKRKSITSDALEAIIGAIYLDGGFANAKEFIINHILNDIDTKQLFFDSKTVLQELIQGRYESEPVYKIVAEEGPAHNRSFTSEVYIGEEKLGRGEGQTKKAAEASAAYEAILKLKTGSK